jgi:hypothetical protein
MKEYYIIIVVVSMPRSGVRYNPTAPDRPRSCFAVHSRGFSKRSVTSRRDLDAVEDLEQWRNEGLAATAHSEELLREAATLLSRTAERLDAAAEERPETSENAEE